MGRKWVGSLYFALVWGCGMVVVMVVSRCDGVEGGGLEFGMEFECRCYVLMKK